VLDRFMAATAARDLQVAVLSPEFALDPGRVDGLRQKLADLDGVSTAAAIAVAPVGANGTQYDFGVMTSPDGGYFVDVDRPMVLAGRLPRPDAVDEIAVNETAVDQLGLSVGDVFRGPTFTAAEAAAFLEDAAVSTAASGPEVSAKVVGVVRQGDELAIRPQSLNPGGIASPAFFRAHAERIGFSVALYALRLDRAVIGLDDVLAEVRQDVGTEHETFASYVEDDYAGEAGAAFRTLSSGLLIVAAIALVVGLLTVLQAVNRHLALSAESESTLRALGLGRRARTLGFGGPCAVAVVAGVAAGLGGAVVLSRWFPPSLARRAEVSPGLDADWFVLVPCAVAVTAVLLLIVAWRAHRAAGRSPTSAASWPARVGSAVRFTGPAATVGVTMAWLARASSSRASPPGATNPRGTGGRGTPSPISWSRTRRRSSAGWSTTPISPRSRPSRARRSRWTRTPSTPARSTTGRVRPALPSRPDGRPPAPTRSPSAASRWNASGCP
jgi:hypothetical protein